MTTSEQDKRVPVVDEVWKRREGRERVRIGRVWEYPAWGFPDDPDYEPPDTAVRCHPCHGGKVWWTLLPEFLARFDPEDPSS